MKLIDHILHRDQAHTKWARILLVQPIPLWRKANMADQNIALVRRTIHSLWIEERWARAFTHTIRTSKRMQPSKFLSNGRRMDCTQTMFFRLFWAKRQRQVAQMLRRKIGGEHTILASEAIWTSTKPLRPLRMSTQIQQSGFPTMAPTSFPSRWGPHPTTTRTSLKGLIEVQFRHLHLQGSWFSKSNLLHPLRLLEMQRKCTLAYRINLFINLRQAR